MHYEEEQQQDKLFIELCKLINAFKQEMLNPQVLIFQAQPFLSLQEAVKEQDQRIKLYIQPDPDGNDIPSQERNFKQIIYKNETEKISYILKAYARLRLQKIEKYAFYLIKNQSYAEKRLSANQYIYMKNYAQLKYRYFEENILKNLFKPYRGLGGLQVYFSNINQLKLQVESNQSKVEIVAPDQSQYCFAHINSNPDLSFRFNYDIKAGNIEGELVIPSGSIVYAPYKNVKGLVASQNAELV